jgi:hypothetical protein
MQHCIEMKQARDDSCIRHKGPQTAKIATVQLNKRREVARRPANNDAKPAMQRTIKQKILILLPFAIVSLRYTAHGKREQTITRSFVRSYS